jgi:metal-sulfur cluster biosynthetic enzyme
MSVTVTVTVDAVRAALNSVIDPCSVAAGVPAGLDDMGLVRSIHLDGEHVDVMIGVTEPTCLMGVIFLRDAEAAIHSQCGVDSVTVRLDHQFRYRESMQRPEYAERLQIARQNRTV